jgi:ubiquitin-protein ligase
MNAINYQEGLNPDIIEVLKCTNITGIKKRLARELFDLQNENAYIHIEYNDNTPISNKIHDNSHVFTIHIVLSGENDLITIEICRDYPFKPPKNIKINYKSYNSFLRIVSQKTLKEFKEIYSQFYKPNIMDCCLCCSSISCPANWSPPVRLINVVQEIKTFKKIRRSIINKLLSSKIINKYLIHDKGFHEYFYSFLFHF